MLSAAVALVLLIAGVNVANLLLARADRAPAGSGRARGARGDAAPAWSREQLAESLLLALGGGAGGPAALRR